jgi:HEAT repeat protein
MVDSGGEASAPVLGAMLETETDNEQRRLIVWALSDIHTDESVAILAKVAKSDPTRETRRIAVQALGAMGTPAAKKALRDLLDD